MKTLTRTFTLPMTRMHQTRQCRGRPLHVASTNEKQRDSKKLIQCNTINLVIISTDIRY